MDSRDRPRSPLPPIPHSSPWPGLGLLAGRLAAWYSAQVPASGLWLPCQRGLLPSPAWAMYPRKIEGLMEVISTGGATPSRLRREGRDVLVGAFAHPEIWVYLWGPLELRRGLQQPLREGL